MDYTDVFKIGGPAILSFMAGRFQASANNKATKVKEIKVKLTDQIRKLATVSIDYHATRTGENEAIRNSALILNHLHQIRTDLGLLKVVLGIDPNQKFALPEYSKVHDAITEFPFDSVEMPLEVDRTRAKKISTACEKLVEKVNKN